MPKLQTLLCLMHMLSLLLIVGAGVFLIVAHNLLLTVEVPRKEVSIPMSISVLSGCCALPGALCVYASAVILANTYCFLALMVPEGSCVVRCAPFMGRIRRELERELQEMDIHEG